MEKELVQLIPRARVWTFGYDSSWSGDFSVDTTINEAAESLLDAIAVHVIVDFLPGLRAEILLILTESPTHAFDVRGTQLWRYCSVESM